MEKNYIEQNEVNLKGGLQEKPEFSGGREGFEVCKICSSVYHKKSWHHFLRSFEKNETVLPIKFVTCPACNMIAKGLYEGRIVIKNVPEKIQSELINLIKNFTHRSFLQDPLDRLIGIKKTKDNFTVTTTENQMAVRLAKKIKDTFNDVDLDIKYSKDPNDDDNVIVIFK